MRGLGRGGAVAVMVALAASAIGDSSTMVLDPPRGVDIDIPRSARGNGSRGRPNNQPTFDRAHANRRRKLALHSKRRNRR